MKKSKKIKTLTVHQLKIIRLKKHIKSYQNEIKILKATLRRVCKMADIAARIGPFVEKRTCLGKKYGYKHYMSSEDFL